MCPTLRFQKDGAREVRLDAQWLFQSNLMVVKPNAFYCPNKLDGHLLPTVYSRSRAWGGGAGNKKGERGEKVRRKCRSQSKPRDVEPVGGFRRNLSSISRYSRCLTGRGQARLPLTRAPSSLSSRCLPPVSSQGNR